MTKFTLLLFVIVIYVKCHAEANHLRVHKHLTLRIADLRKDLPFGVKKMESRNNFQEKHPGNEYHKEKGTLIDDEDEFRNFRRHKLTARPVIEGSGDVEKNVAYDDEDLGDTGSGSGSGDGHLSDQFEGKEHKWSDEERKNRKEYTSHKEGGKWDKISDEERKNHKEYVSSDGKEKLHHLSDEEKKYRSAESDKIEKALFNYDFVYV